MEISTKTATTDVQEFLNEPHLRKLLEIRQGFAIKLEQAASFSDTKKAMEVALERANFAIKEFLLIP